MFIYLSDWLKYQCLFSIIWHTWELHGSRVSKDLTFAGAFVKVLLFLFVPPIWFWRSWVTAVVVTQSAINCKPSTSQQFRWRVAFFASPHNTMFASTNAMHFNLFEFSLPGLEANISSNPLISCWSLQTTGVVLLDLFCIVISLPPSPLWQTASKFMCTHARWA